MTDLNLLTEWEFKAEIVKWRMKYDRIYFRKETYEFEDYVRFLRLPEIDYVHVDSFYDSDGDMITYLKGSMKIDRTQSKNTRSQEVTFYYVIRTFIDCPEVEPYPMGYYIISYKEGL